MKGYAAVRGEELESDAANRAREIAHLQARLDLIGLLEGRSCAPFLLWLAALTGNSLRPLCYCRYATFRQLQLGV